MSFFEMEMMSILWNETSFRQRKDQLLFVAMRSAKPSISLILTSYGSKILDLKCRLMIHLHVKLLGGTIW